jgi:histidinol-phosphate aminotransferase
MPSVTHLIRSDIADLEPYTPAEPLDVLAERLHLPVERIIKLDINENPYGPSPRVLVALGHEQHYAFYPDPIQRHLRAALSTFTGQPAERIFCGVGADEVIDLLLRLFIQPGDMVIACPPTFGMYAFDTAVCGGRFLEVPYRADFTLDLSTIEHVATETRAKVLFLASPNNPTGNAIPRAQIERLLQLPLLVVVDEAYIEFCHNGDFVYSDYDVSDLVGRNENLVVLRTLSKWAGLAGLRIGYGLIPEAIVNQLWKIKQPYNVSLLAQVAALASLEDLDYLWTNVAHIVAERERMLKALHELSYLTVYPSQANFIFYHVNNGGLLKLKHALEREGVIVRYFYEGRLRDHICMGIGRPEQNNVVLAVLRNYGDEDVKSN